MVTTMTMNKLKKPYKLGKERGWENDLYVSCCFADTVGCVAFERAQLGREL